MAATSERSLSPLLSVQRERTPPVLPDAVLSLIHDRIRHLESQIGEIRLTVLTQDGYIERRNREDKHIQREFDAHKSVSDRIDANVTIVKTQVAQIESTLSQLKLKIDSLGKDTTSPRDDVGRIQENVVRLQVDVTSLKNQIRGCVGEIVNLHTTVTEMQNDIKALLEQISSMGRRFDRIEERFDGIEERFNVIEKHVDDFTAFKNRMTQANATRFNPLAYDLNSFITPVPRLDEDGALHYPSYFPDTVWRFWRLKQPRKLNRLIQLAEFYELGGYQRWGRTLDHYHARLDDSDSSYDSDNSNNLTRAEATRRYPEACHRALAATVGLDYRRIQKEISEVSSHRSPRPTKRRAEDIISSTSKSAARPIKKIAQGYRDISPTFLQQLVRAVPSLKTKSSKSDHEDRLEYHDKWSEISEDKINNLSDGLPDDPDLLIRLIARRLVTVKPGVFDQINNSQLESRHEVVKAESPKEHVRKEVIHPKESFPEDNPPPTQNTVSTELIMSFSPNEESR